MNWIFRISVFLLIYLMLSSCAVNKNEELKKHLKTGIEQNGFSALLEKDFLMIVPRAGCMGCISAAESFMLESYVKYAGKINFLLTDVSSYKTARVRFGLKFLVAANVFIDQQGAFDNPDFSSLYPMIPLPRPRESN